MKSCAYLQILSPEPTPRQIKGIAPRLGPPIEELALLLNAPEGAQVAIGIRDQVVVENRVELTHRPPVWMLLPRNAPFSPLGRQPASEGWGARLSTGRSPTHHRPRHAGRRRPPAPVGSLDHGPSPSEPIPGPASKGGCPDTPCPYSDGEMQPPCGLPWSWDRAPARQSVQV